MLKIHMRLESIGSFKLHETHMTLELRRRHALKLVMSDGGVLPLIAFTTSGAVEGTVVVENYLGCWIFSHGVL